MYLIKVLHERSLELTTTKSMLSTQLQSVSVHHTELHTIRKITVLKECINFTSKYLYLIKVLHKRSLQLTTTKSILSPQLASVSSNNTYLGMIMLQYVKYIHVTRNFCAKCNISVHILDTLMTL